MPKTNPTNCHNTPSGMSCQLFSTFAMTFESVSVHAITLSNVPTPPLRGFAGGGGEMWRRGPALKGQRRRRG
jgi:hypothetical protein